MALSQLNPQIIGAEMEHGFAGSYARQPDMIVVTRPVGEKEPLPFGIALMYDANGAVVLMQGSGVTADRFAGVAGREMRSALSYTDQNTGAYTTGDAGSVFQRGSINVLCQKGTPKRGGAVYVRIIKNTSLPNAVVGGFEAEADSTSANTVKLTGCQWGGSADANGVAELVILRTCNRRNRIWQISRMSAISMPVCLPRSWAVLRRPALLLPWTQQALRLVAHS